MNKSAIMLSVISKVMQSDYTVTNECDKIYTFINTEFTNALNNSHYPKAAEVLNKMNDLADSLETAFLCKEFFGKRVFSIIGSDDVYINNILKTIKEIFVEDISALGKIRTRIPYIISDSEQLKITVINYNNCSIDFSPDELKVLVDTCFFNKIDISKLVRFVKIHAPLKIKDVCIVIDNKHSSKWYSRFSCKRLVCVRNADGNKNSKRDILTPEGVLINSEAGVSYQSFTDYLLQNRIFRLYGFYEEYQASAAPVFSYYTNTINKLNSVIQAITNDIARVSGSMKNENDLKKFRKDEEEKLKILRNELSGLKNLFTKAETEIKRLCDQMNSKCDSCTIISDNVCKYILEGIFSTAAMQDVDAVKTFAVKLQQLDYPFSELVFDYVKYVKNGTAKCIDTSKCIIYPTAKMAVAISDVDKLEINELKRLLNEIGKSNLETGKEFYAMALWYKYKNDTSDYILYLKDSLRKGYIPAGQKLFELYDGGMKKNIKLSMLANSLIPEACMQMAEEKNKSINKPKYRFSLSCYEMTYYKLAASKEYIPAIEKIVEVIYDEYFSTARQIWDKDKSNPKFNSRKENGHTVCMLCQYLIDKKVKPTHYKGIQGVVTFCLNENLMEARSLLSGINTKAANYCKGIMYEFGQGGEMDLDKAIDYYEKAGDFANAEHCLERAENKSYSYSCYYDDDDDYSYSSSYSAKEVKTVEPAPDSWCFITTAACTALEKGDNCEELNTLRQFRDEYVKSTDFGELLVFEYYRIAPSIVAKLDELPDASDEYYRLWLDYIKPSCRKIAENKREEAVNIYIEMVKVLCKRFNIMIDEDISAKIEVR